MEIQSRTSCKCKWNPTILSKGLEVPWRREMTAFETVTRGKEDDYRKHYGDGRKDVEGGLMPDSFCLESWWRHLLYSEVQYVCSVMCWKLSVQLLSRIQLFVTPWTTAHQASLSITSSQSPPKPMSIELVMPSNHLILCCPLFLLPSIFPSIRVFSNESALRIRWPEYWSFSFSISPSNEHPGLISFRMDWLDLLAAQGTLKSLLQHYSSKASILQCSLFFIVQLSHPYNRH